tara:strand:- start:1648 stop:1866 length:219 start_codon:yes stop_codon:yes gene_type:complete
MQVCGFLNSNISGKVAGTLLLGGALYLSITYLSRYWRNRKEQAQITAQETTQETTQEETQETAQELETENSN